MEPQTRPLIVRGVNTEFTLVETALRCAFVLGRIQRSSGEGTIGIAARSLLKAFNLAGKAIEKQQVAWEKRTFNDATPEQNVEARRISKAMGIPFAKNPRDAASEALHQDLLHPAGRVVPMKNRYLANFRKTIREQRADAKN